MFTVQDVIHLIQYYYHTSSWEGAATDVEGLRLTSIRGQLHYQWDGESGADSTDIEREIKVTPPSLLSIHPLRPLYDACRYLIRTHARRLPLIDKDSQTGAEVVISVLTQYRVLKFIATNVSLYLYKYPWYEGKAQVLTVCSAETLLSTSPGVFETEGSEPMSTRRTNAQRAIRYTPLLQPRSRRRSLTLSTCSRNGESVQCRSSMARAK